MQPSLATRIISIFLGAGLFLLFVGEIAKLGVGNWEVWLDFISAIAVVMTATLSPIQTHQKFRAIEFFGLTVVLLIALFLERKADDPALFAWFNFAFALAFAFLGLLDSLPPIWYYFTDAKSLHPAVPSDARPRGE